MTVDRLQVGYRSQPIDLERAIAGADAAVVAGGDGTVLSVAPACVSTGVPLYHLPTGNENLFAREFGMDTNPARLVWALQRGRVARCDVGRCSWNGASAASSPRLSSPFLLMASIGPDAGVVHRLHATRTKAVGHRAYVQPILDELASPAVSRVKVWCDGATEPVIDGRGMLVVANCRQYALRVDPSPRANPCDGLLDACFIPAETAVDALAALVRLRLRRGCPDLVRARAQRMAVEIEPVSRLQLDGEAIATGGAGTQLLLSLDPGFLAVLDVR